jgi:tellurium resistance protein TerZ
VYYKNRKEYRSFVKHYGDDTSGSNKQHESDNEVIFLNLNKTPNNVSSIAVVLNAFTGEKLSKVPNLKCRIYSGNPGEVQDILGTFDISEQSNLKTTSVIVGYFNKDLNNEWSFIAVGEASNAHRFEQLQQSFSMINLKPKIIKDTKILGSTLSSTETLKSILSRIKTYFLKG